MKTGKRMEEAAVESEGGRRPTGDSTAEAPGATGPLAPNQRWSVSRKRDVVLRMLRGESSEALSRELKVESNKLERWRDRALAGMESGLLERVGDPKDVALDDAMRRIGELSMEVDLLRERTKHQGPFGLKRSGR